MNKTETGKDCQRWSSDVPHSHDYNWVGKHNYCRNPVARGPGRTKTDVRAWCYTMESTTWEYCDIRDCTKCDQGKNVKNYPN